MKSIRAITLALALSMLITPILVLRPVSLVQAQPTPGAPVYFSVEPVAISPLTDLNSSLNGLETPATPSPVGQNFTVEIHLRGGTADNVPNGCAGVEVHFDFSNILNYCKPVGFSNLLTQPDGVLNAPVIYAIVGGFYKADGSTYVASPPYTGAMQYRVAGSTTGTPWNAADGLVATITFEIIKQPLGSSGEKTVNLELANSFTDLTDGFAAEVTIDNVQGTLTIDATSPPPGQYALTVNVVGSGSVAENPSLATYPSGTSVTLTATPASSWLFQGWSGDLTGSQNPVNITMNANKTVTATFVVTSGQQYALTVNVVGSGSVAEKPSSATYLIGTNVTLTATPATGWMFHHWSGDLSGGLNPINITMVGDKNVTVTFSKLGNLNNDPSGKAKLLDLTKFAQWYGMTNSSSLWNVAVDPWCAPSAADFCNKGRINLADLVTLAVYYNSSH